MRNTLVYTTTTGHPTRYWALEKATYVVRAVVARTPGASSLRVAEGDGQEWEASIEEAARRLAEGRIRVRDMYAV